MRDVSPSKAVWLTRSEKKKADAEAATAKQDSGKIGTEAGSNESRLAKFKAKFFKH